MIISIHIPKTGGTSFGEVLRGVYGDRLWTNYDTQWNSETSISASIPDEAEILHGHFEFDAFDHMFPQASKVTWLRDPVERTISLYNHIMQRPDFENDLIMEIYQNRPSIVEFSKIPWVTSNAMNYLKGAQPHDFLFIGFLEQFEKSLRLCAKLLNWNKMPSLAWLNKREGTNSTKYSDEVRSLIRNENLDEYEWVNEAKSLFLDKIR